MKLDKGDSNYCSNNSSYSVIVHFLFHKKTSDHEKIYFTNSNYNCVCQSLHCSIIPGLSQQQLQWGKRRFF